MLLDLRWFPSLGKKLLSPLENYVATIRAKNVNAWVFFSWHFSSIFFYFFCWSLEAKKVEALFHWDINSMSNVCKLYKHTHTQSESHAGGFSNSPPERWTEVGRRSHICVESVSVSVSVTVTVSNFRFYCETELPKETNKCCQDISAGWLEVWDCLLIVGQKKKTRYWLDIMGTWLNGMSLRLSKSQDTPEIVAEMDKN